jgi:hypothetical protein
MTNRSNEGPNSTPPDLRLQFSLRALFAELALAAVALVIVKMLSSMGGRWAQLLGWMTMLFWLVAAAAIVYPRPRWVAAWGTIVSTCFVVVGDPVLGGPLIRVYWETLIYMPDALWSVAATLVPLQATLILSSVIVGTQPAKSLVGLVGIATLAILLGSMRPQEFLGIWIVSRVPTVAFGAYLAWIDVWELIRWWNNRS